MPTGKPARRIRTAMIYGYNLGGHPLASSSCEPIPGLREIKAVTLCSASTLVPFYAVKITQNSVVGTFYKDKINDLKEPVPYAWAQHAKILAIPLAISTGQWQPGTAVSFSLGLISTA